MRVARENQEQDLLATKTQVKVLHGEEITSEEAWAVLTKIGYTAVASTLAAVGVVGGIPVAPEVRDAILAGIDERLQERQRRHVKANRR